MGQLAIWFGEHVARSSLGRLVWLGPFRFQDDIALYFALPNIYGLRRLSSSPAATIATSCSCWKQGAGQFRMTPNCINHEGVGATCSVKTRVLLIGEKN